MKKESKGDARKRLLGTLLTMTIESDKAKKMTDNQLWGDVLEKVWAEYPMNSVESAILSELLERFRKGRWKTIKAKK